jgi:hypothetical protein
LAPFPVCVQDLHSPARSAKYALARAAQANTRTLARQNGKPDNIA